MFCNRSNGNVRYNKNSLVEAGTKIGGTDMINLQFRRAGILAIVFVLICTSGVTAVISMPREDKILSGRDLLQKIQSAPTSSAPPAEENSHSGPARGPKSQEASRRSEGLAAECFGIGLFRTLGGHGRSSA